MASRIRRLRARLLKAMFRTHAHIYEASGGRLGSHLMLPMLLLTVKGRKTCQPRTTPLAYFEDGGTYVVVGSDGGARRDPQWWKNLQEDPHARIRVGRDVFNVTARLALGEERERLWTRGETINPNWARYQTLTSRPLPVVLFEPSQTGQ